MTTAKVQRLGIRTGADLRTKPLAFLQQHFGKSATRYLGIANGKDERPVWPTDLEKSSGSETTFQCNLTPPAEIEAMADDMWAWMRKGEGLRSDRHGENQVC